MPFGNNFPDESKIIESIERVRAAFDAAAGRPGASQPLFERLSQKFGKLVDDALAMRHTNEDPQKAIMKMMPTIMDLQLTFSALRKKAETDPSIADTMRALQEAVREEAQNFTSGLDLSSLGGLLGGLGGLKRPGADDITPPPANDQAPEPKKDTPKKGKPKSGDFKI